jgi:hypothetical protein
MSEQSERKPTVDYVFISYARDDLDFALKLATQLKERNVLLWIDQWEIYPNDDWAQAIDEAIVKCAHFLIVLSPAAIKSRYIRVELFLALDEDKPIVPVLYQACRIPRLLQPLQYIDCTARGTADDFCLSQILRALEA